MGGSSDTEVNDPIVKPTGSPSCSPDTIVTPVGKCPSTVRKSWGSMVGWSAVSLIPADTRLRRVRDVTSAKRELRREMRAMRRSLPDQAERSEVLWTHVEEIDEVRAARTIMAFDSVPGEPVTEGFVSRARERGVTVVMPEDDPPPEHGAIDVVIVPGTAFGRDGTRLGQGGGWYDRFLTRVRPDCLTIGVGFEPQLFDDLPTEPHDVPLDMVITDAGRAT